MTIRHIHKLKLKHMLKQHIHQCTNLIELAIVNQLSVSGKNLLKYYTLFPASFLLQRVPNIDLQQSKNQKITQVGKGLLTEVCTFQ